MPHASRLWSSLGLCLLLELSRCWAGFLEDNYPASVLEDAHLTTLELLSKYKYPAEEHQVTTEDNYLLKMHRIARPGANPVLLMHGLLDCSSTWVMMGPHSGLGYFLYDAGYDVWMGNVRGSRYSRGHVKLNPNTDKAYWSFSWHEIGLYDLPAMIDAVLAKTGYSKLSYFGHSQGTTTFFVMASSRPEYNAKVHVLSAIAPVAYMGHIKAPLLPLGRSMISMFPDQFEILPHSDLGLKQCMRTASTLQMCMYYMGEMLGRNPAEVNKTMMPVLLGLVPAGCNTKQPRHYMQLQASNRFAQFDYGKENQRIYGRATPPEYAVEKITVPVALYYAQNDYLAAVEDVQRLRKRLPNVVEDHLFPYKKWNHVDMLWGITSRRRAQPRMLQVMQRCEAGEVFNATGITTVATPEEPENELEEEEQQEKEEQKVEEGVKKVELEKEMEEEME